MWLNLRTEFSFRQVYGTVAAVAEAASGCVAAGIADFGNTFGHVPWAKACKKAGIRPVFGVVLDVVEDVTVRDRAEAKYPTLLVARNNAGLRAIYKAVQQATEDFFWTPRLGRAFIGGLPPDEVLVATILHGLERPVYTPLGPDSFRAGPNPLALADNYYPHRGDREVYELFTAPTTNTKTTEQHILSEAEWRQCCGGNGEADAALPRAAVAIALCTAELGHAPMVRYTGTDTLAEWCKEGAATRGINLRKKAYRERLKRELDMIEEKDYADYFLVVADMVRFAKTHMLVGPSRGSSAGSLVCYLVGITEIDPLKHGLLFERFIDINRKDLPDIDIDFPDEQREEVFKYLAQRYGPQNVARIGTITRMMPKSALGQFSAALGIDFAETEAIKDAIIERSTGDARAAQCIEDTFESTEVGKAYIARYPQMNLVRAIEGHAAGSSVHAAGVIVGTKPIADFVGINAREKKSVAMVDKYDAERLGLLKIDVLGLRNLTILQDCLQAIGQSYNWLYGLPLNDDTTFELFRTGRLAGIFQFEGYALQSLTRQMSVDTFEDLVAITSLARPGPLHSGGATLFIARRNGYVEPTLLYDHPAIKDSTEETYGIIIYQEQVMQIGRLFGGLSWEDVSTLRKAMSSSLGEEFFNKFKERFLTGTRKQGVPDKDAVKVWEHMCTFGSWGFNKSHAVSYSLISYWTAYLKAWHPLQYACAYMNHVKDERFAIRFLRDMVENSKIKFTALDPQHSMEQWTVQKGKLLGGLTNVRGLGPVKARDIVRRRASRQALQPGQLRLLAEGGTPYDDLWPARTRYGAWYADPEAYKIKSAPLDYISSVERNGVWVFLGRLVDRNLRDLNEYGNIVKRGGEIMTGPTLFLNLTIEDDTDSIICTIGRFQFEKMGRPIAETATVGEDWFLVRGEMRNNWRKIYIEKIKRL